MKLFLKSKKIKYHFLYFLLWPMLSNTAPVVQGYWQPGPNEFWPFTSPAWNGSGNQIQQNSPFTNPDVFCKMQGNGFRTFSIGEMDGFLRHYHLFGDNKGFVPTHWSNYYNNDINQPLRNKFTTAQSRQVGGLFNEWGDLNQYSNGWNQPFYWSAHPYSASQRHTMLGNGAQAPAGSGNVALNYGVVCVTDLIPIPFLDQSHVENIEKS